MLKNDTNKYLVLVNKNHKLPENWPGQIKMVEAQNSLGRTFLLEQETKKHFEDLKEQLESLGIFIELDSTYRSVEKQEEIWNDFMEKYGEEYCKTHVAVPGYSEHHTGLAIDICLVKNGIVIDENDKMLEEEDLFNQIHSLLPQYGFITRYPKDKEHITGYGYEPWHFRYTGETEAKMISNHKVSLEEYLDIDTV